MVLEERWSVQIVHGPQQAIDVVSLHSSKLNDTQKVPFVDCGVLLSCEVRNLFHCKGGQAGTDSEATLLVYIHQQQLLVCIREELVDGSSVPVCPHFGGDATQHHTVLDKVALQRSQKL